MNFDNIVETRKVDGGAHSLVLEIAKEELDKSFRGNINQIAEKVVSKHLMNRGDDGRARDVKMEYKDDEDIVKIYANVDYLGNDHTEYSRH